MSIKNTRKLCCKNFGHLHVTNKVVSLSLCPYYRYIWGKCKDLPRQGNMHHVFSLGGIVCTKLSEIISPVKLLHIINEYWKLAFAIIVFALYILHISLNPSHYFVAKPSLLFSHECLLFLSYRQLSLFLSLLSQTSFSDPVFILLIVADSSWHQDKMASNEKIRCESFWELSS